MFPHMTKLGLFTTISTLNNRERCSWTFIN